jgi:hypothetical protein
MNYKEVKQELKNEFDSFLKPIGYKSKIALQGCDFILKSNLQQIIMSFGVVNYIDEFTTSTSIRLNIIVSIRGSTWVSGFSVCTIFGDNAIIM